jgi:AraC-like DNA-binding protein
MSCLLLNLPENKNGTDPFFTDKKLYFEMRELAETVNQPIMKIEDDLLLYGSFIDDNQNCYIIGPAALEPLTKQQLLNFMKKHCITQKEIYIECGSFKILSNLLAMAFWIATGKEVIEQDIILNFTNNNNYVATEGEIGQYQFEKSEYDKENNKLDYEYRYLKAIEMGDIDYFQNNIQQGLEAMDGIGRLANSSKKQMEYMCVASIALIARAATRGNFNPAKAFELSEVYLQKLDKCKDIQEIIQVHRSAQLDFTMHVKASREKQRNAVYVEQCKDYIIKHIRMPFKVEDIAEAISINASYLSRKFSQQEKITIQQYINKERVKGAANMLKYSDYRMSEIAEYFCFSSQSHFGKQFKKEYGVTPYEFRKQNKYIESINTGRIAFDDDIKIE